MAPYITVIGIAGERWNKLLLAVLASLLAFDHGCTGRGIKRR
jgi:hypothetical protein